MQLQAVRMDSESWVYNQNIRAPGCLLLADANEQRQELNLKTVLHSESQKSEKTLDQHLKNLSSSSSLSDMARNGGSQSAVPEWHLIPLVRGLAGLETDICASRMKPHTLPSCSRCMNSGIA